MGKLKISLNEIEKNADNCYEDILNAVTEETHITVMDCAVILYVGIRLFRILGAGLQDIFPIMYAILKKLFYSEVEVEEC